MASYWEGKRALVTGGTSGLGRALALELAGRGAQVAIVARTREGLRETGRACPRELVTIQADVASKADTYRISAEALARLGGIDLLVNNASSLGPTPLRLLLDTECEDFASVLETNVLGPFRLTKALLPAMMLQRSGMVLNISSDAAVSAYSGWGAYGASKAALAQLSRIWDEETRARGVRFLSVDPGDMNTPMHAVAVPDADPATLADPRDAALKLLERLEALDRDSHRRTA